MRGKAEGQYSSSDMEEEKRTRAMLIETMKAKNAAGTACGGKGRGT